VGVFLAELLEVRVFLTEFRLLEILLEAGLFLLKMVELVFLCKLAFTALFGVGAVLIAKEL